MVFEVFYCFFVGCVVVLVGVWVVGVYYLGVCFLNSVVDLGVDFLFVFVELGGFVVFGDGCVGS